MGRGRYREREKLWRNEAKKALDGDRDDCLELAEGYARLIEIIERRQPKSTWGRIGHTSQKV
jgi:hypothetical protein